MHVLAIWREAAVVMGARWRWSPIQLTGLNIEEWGEGRGVWDRKREKEEKEETERDRYICT